ncbi:MAG: NAD(P)H-hydrate dehydratase [Ignavibacteria bacterium]|nr:NAD(P)H-hydrate dehydratase [Ignavibacteria bacterium]
MIPLFTNNQVRAVDRFAIEQLNFPSLLLMENAASSLFNIISEKGFLSKTPTSVGILCGKGNNGGDGFALARKIAFAGHKVVVLHLSDKRELSADAKKNYELLLSSTLLYKNIFIKKITKVGDINILRSFDVIIDALLGSGSQGDLKGLLKEIVEKINTFSNKKIAIDVPTGLNADTGYGATIFKADLTITLGALKRGLFFGDGYASSGVIKKGEIGVGDKYFEEETSEDFLVEGNDVKTIIPPKREKLNKYSSGKVLLFAGSKEYGGAAVLSSSAAFKSGAGAVILAIPDSLQKILLQKRPESVIQFYGEKNTEYLSSEFYSSLKEKLIWSDVIAIGPGLGRHAETMNFVSVLLRKHPNKKIVVDADALFALRNKEYRNYKLKNAVFTPHLGEFSSLINVDSKLVEKDLLFYGKEFVKETKATLVLKGPRTIVFSADGLAFINPTGNPGLAKFGSGDVLTGMIASFLAQIKNTRQAVLSAVYLHGMAADQLKKEKTAYGFTAGDVANQIPFTLKELNNAL